MTARPTLTLYAEYRDWCLGFNGRHLFRGQNRDHPTMPPSINRPGAVEIGVNAAELIRDLYFEAYDVTNRSEAAEEDEQAYLYEQAVSGSFPTSLYSGMFSDYWKFELDDHHREALLQHYGVPSRGLDVTFEPMVALFFAAHRVVTFSDGSAAYERKREPGVVFVMSRGDRRLIDLRGGRELPKAGLRGEQQHGALLFPSGDSTDLKGAVVASVSVAPEIWGTLPWENKIDMRTLFPDSGQDPLYRTLLDRRRDSRYQSITKFVTQYRYE